MFPCWDPCSFTAIDMTLFPSCVFNIFNILPITDTLNFFGFRDYHGGEKRAKKKMSWHTVHVMSCAGMTILKIVIKTYGSLMKHESC